MLVRIYRLLRLADSNFGLTVFWLYVALFVMTFALIFVMPPVALILVFLGLAGLVAAVLVGRVLHLVTSRVASSLIRSGCCPRCSERTPPLATAPDAWHCSECGAAFHAFGTEVDEAESLPSSEESPGST